MMLMGCLAAGPLDLAADLVGGRRQRAGARSPALTQRVRSQFKTPIGKLEGVEEALGRSPPTPT
jgi:acyl-CoA dehydrogenase